MCLPLCANYQTTGLDRVEKDRAKLNAGLYSKVNDSSSASEYWGHHVVTDTREMLCRFLFREVLRSSQP